MKIITFLFILFFNMPHLKAMEQTDDKKSKQAETNLISPLQLLPNDLHFSIVLYCKINDMQKKFEYMKNNFKVLNQKSLYKKTEPKKFPLHECSATFPHTILCWNLMTREKYLIISSDHHRNLTVTIENDTQQLPVSLSDKNSNYYYYCPTISRDKTKLAIVQTAYSKKKAGDILQIYF